MSTTTFNIASDSNVTIRSWGNWGEDWGVTASGTYYPYSGHNTYVIPFEGEYREAAETSFYFSSITIPKGATINSAVLNFTTYSYTDSIFSLDIQACDEDNSTLISSLSDFGSRARTTASINWTGSSITADTNYDTADFKSVIQEIVNRSGWSSGNHLQLIISDHTYKYSNYPGENVTTGYLLMNLDSVSNISLTIDYTYSNVKKYESVLYDNIKKVNGVAIANVKKLMGVA